MAKARKTYVWKDPGGFTLAVTILMVVNIAIRLASVGVLTVFGGGALITGKETEFTPPQSLFWIVGMLELAALVVGVIVPLWVLRLSRNAHVFKPGMTYSPIGALGWYFVPFLSLVKPYEAMSEIWSASATTKDDSRSALLNWWWGLFLFGGLLRIIARVTELGAAPVIASDIVSIAIAVVVIRMARELCRMQRARHAAWDVFGPPEEREISVLERVST